MYPSCCNTQSLVLVPSSHSVREPAGASALGEPGGEISITDFILINIAPFWCQEPDTKHEKTYLWVKFLHFQVHDSPVALCSIWVPVVAYCACAVEKNPDSRIQQIVPQISDWLSTKCSTETNSPIAFGKLNSSAECDWSIWNSILRFWTTNLKFRRNSCQNRNVKLLQIFCSLHSDVGSSKPTWKTWYRAIT